MYDTSKLRKLDTTKVANIRVRSNVTLICVKGTGEITYARTRGDKDKMLEEIDWGSDVILWPWVGQFHTDVFLVTKEDVEKYYK